MHYAKFTVSCCAFPTLYTIRISRNASSFGWYSVWRIELSFVLCIVGAYVYDVGVNKNGTFGSHLLASFLLDRVICEKLSVQCWWRIKWRPGTTGCYWSMAAGCGCRATRQLYITTGHRGLTASSQSLTSSGRHHTSTLTFSLFDVVSFCRQVSVDATPNRFVSNLMTLNNGKRSQLRAISAVAELVRCGEIEPRQNTTYRWVACNSVTCSCSRVCACVCVSVSDKAVRYNYNSNRQLHHMRAAAAAAAESAMDKHDSHVASLTDAYHRTSHVTRTCRHVTTTWRHSMITGATTTTSASRICMTHIAAHVWRTVNFPPAQCRHTTIHCTTTTTSVHKGHRRLVTTAHAQCTVQWLCADTLIQTCWQDGRPTVVELRLNPQWEGMVVRSGSATSTWWWIAQ